MHIQRLLLFIEALSYGECVVQLVRRKTLHNFSLVRTQNYSSNPLPPVDAFSREGLELGLDVLIVADHSLYEAFFEMARDHVSAQHYAQQYLNALFLQMKIIFEGVKVHGEILHLHLAGIHLALRSEDCPLLSDSNFNESSFDVDNSSIPMESRNNFTDLTKSVSAVRALHKSKSWIKQNYEALPKHDYAIVFTKFDLLSPFGASATQGLAYVGHICRPMESVSVVEDVGAGATALIAAHELGHSLGAVHDGEKVDDNDASGCAPSLHFLMAALLSGNEHETMFQNTRKMSSCSLKAFESMLRKPSASCAWKPKRVHQREELMPGETFIMHRQCQVAFAPHYGICSTDEYYRKDLCRRLWCVNRKLPGWQPCETHVYFPAFDGTSCGNNKWCQAGTCVVNEKKVDKCHDLNAKTCARYSAAKLRHYCKAQDFRDICCATCNKSIKA